jgi:tRNA G37 N-methylase Trm5
MNKSLTVKAYSLKVYKVLGEKAIRLATNLGLLNRDLKVRSEDEYLFIPLDQKPTCDNIAEFNNELYRFDILSTTVSS